jgi:signal peptidase
MSAAAFPVGAERRSHAWANRALTVIIAALAIVLVLGLGLRVAGLTALVDYTDSMRPAIAAGDVVLDKTVRASELRPGQIASIPDPGAGNRLVTHRVVSATTTGGRVTIVTKGDANDASERWVLAADAPTKRMVARVPWIGHVMAWFASPLLRAILLMVGAIAVLGYGLTRLRKTA